MKIAEIPFAAMRFQYHLARIPLQLIEDQMAARLDEEAPVRLFYERSLGSIDTVVGKLLGDAWLSRRGTALVERSNALARAARLGAECGHADADVDAAHDGVVSEISEARGATEQEAVNARMAATQSRRTADE